MTLCIVSTNHVSGFAFTIQASQFAVLSTSDSGYKMGVRKYRA